MLLSYYFLPGEPNSLTPLSRNKPVCQFSVDAEEREAGHHGPVDMVGCDHEERGGEDEATNDSDDFHRGSLFGIGSRSTHFTPWPSFWCVIRSALGSRLALAGLRWRSLALAMCRHLRPAFRRVPLFEIPCWWLEGMIRR